MSLTSIAAPSVTISIDLEPPEGETPPREADEAVVRALVDQLGEAGIAATWFAAEPATSTALHQALDANCGHEAAIAMVGNWSGHENGRSRFATEFLRRKRAAERANIAVTALTTSEGTPPESFELLVRHGISAIRTVGSKTARRNTRSEFPGTTRLRFGLWQIDEVSQVASGGFLNGHFAARRICRTVDAAIADRSILHLAINSSRIAGQRRTTLDGFSKILKHIANRRNDGLHAGSLAEIIAQLAAPKLAQRAQSVLRAA